MLRFAALALLASTASGYADTTACDAIRFGPTAPAIGLRHDKILNLATSTGNAATDFAIIASPPSDPGIRKIMLAANLAGTLPLECGNGPDPASGKTCDMTLPGQPLELVVTFAPDDAEGAENRAQAIARYVADEVLCPMK